MLVVGLILHFTGKKITFAVVELFCTNSVMLLKYVFGYSSAPGQISDTIWAASREKNLTGICQQQNRRSTCATAQADWRLYFTLWLVGHINCHTRIFLIF